jgi:hypothetical protein
MSIQGIRRIRDTKITSPERTLRVQPGRSKERSNFFTPPINIMVPAEGDLQLSVKPGLFDMTRSTQHPASRHRKTGSLGLPSRKEKDYYELVSNQL